uniref:Embryonal stem cell-specific gene 1 protein n=1 Tax=Oryctolagus cuniculus TaxID=9986 RepID=A0A5F9CIX5_RABIT
MGTLPKRKDIPPWVKVPEDLKDPEVLQVQTRLLEAMFGPDGSRIPYIEQVSKAMLELKALESSDLTEVVVYGSYMYKLRTKWMLQSMAEWHRQRQERGETLGDSGAPADVTGVASFLGSPCPLPTATSTQPRWRLGRPQTPWGGGWSLG